MLHDHDNPQQAVLDHRAHGSQNATPLAATSQTPLTGKIDLLWVSFPELYERHLCRHTQFGLNVAHIMTVVGCYFAVFGIGASCLKMIGLGEQQWLLLLLTIPYLVIMALNVPVRVMIACLVFMTGFFACFYAGLDYFLMLPAWSQIPLCVAVILLSHRAQNWSHLYWNREYDMSRFKEKYPKGFKMFFLLTYYEQPILLNYLVFDRKSWSA